MVMRHWLVLMLAACTLLLGGCDAILGDTKTVRVSAAVPLSDADLKILSSRLQAHLSSDRPNFSAELEKGAVVLHARGLPAAAALQFLLGHQGVLELKGGDNDVGFTQRDIADSQAGFDPNNKPVLRLRLTGPGAANFSQFSSRKAGQLVFASLDGEPIATLKVPGRIDSERLQVVINKTPEELVLLVTVLKYGALGARQLVVAVQ